MCFRGTGFNWILYRLAFDGEGDHLPLKSPLQLAFSGGIVDVPTTKFSFPAGSP